MNGTIPSELGILPNIKVLYLNDNKLTGSLPSELGQLTTLRKCFLCVGVVAMLIFG